MPDRDSLISADAVRVVERDPASLVQLATWPDRLADFSTCFAASPLPGQGEILPYGEGELMRLAAGVYLLLDADAPALGESGGAIDLGNARRIFNISGEGASDLLRRGVGIDLHIAAFPIGTLRQTPVGHIDALILRRAENAFDVLISSSLRQSFRDWTAGFRA